MNPKGKRTVARNTRQEEPADAAKIQSALTELEEIANLPGFVDSAVPFLECKRNYAAFWAKAKETGSLFKGAHIPHGLREKLWAKQSDLCERVREFQNREREARYYDSQRNRDQILPILEEARNWLKGSRELGHLRESRRLLAQAMRLMKETTPLKQDRNACWQLWSEVNRLIPFRRQEILELNCVDFDHDVNRIADLSVYQDPHEALKAIQEAQREIKSADLSREQRQCLRSALQKYWDIAVGRIDEERRTEHVRKHQEWRGRMEEKRDRLEALLEKNESVIERIRDQIDELESQIADSSNNAWVERARGWIEEKYEKIGDIEQTDKDLEGKIREIRSQLEE